MGKMNTVEAGHQIEAGVRQNENGFFTSEEEAIIAHYQRLLVSGQACLDLEIKAELIPHGLLPSRLTVLEEVGSVWGFLNEIELRSKDPDFLALQLGIQPERLADRELSPGQKFLIYTRAIVLCCLTKTKQERSALLVKT